MVLIESWICENIYYSPLITYLTQILNLKNNHSGLGVEGCTYKICLVSKKEFAQQKLMRYSGTPHSFFFFFSKSYFVLSPCPFDLCVAFSLPPFIWIKLLMRKQGTKIKVSWLHRKSGGRLRSHFQQPIQKSHWRKSFIRNSGRATPGQSRFQMKESTRWFAHLKRAHRDPSPHTCKDLAFNFDVPHCLLLLWFQ